MSIDFNIFTELQQEIERERMMAKRRLKRMSQDW